MAIQTLSDTGIQIPHSYDGAAYAVSMPDCVCGELGDEMEIHYVTGSLSVSFYAGSQAVIGGQFFHVTENESLMLAPNSDGYICAEIDATRPVGSTGSFVFLTGSEIRRENINGNGSVRDLLLYRVVTGPSDVTNVYDLRVVAGVPHVQAYLTQDAYDALPSKNELVDYNIWE